MHISASLQLIYSMSVPYKLQLPTAVEVAVTSRDASNKQCQVVRVNDIKYKFINYTSTFCVCCTVHAITCLHVVTCLHAVACVHVVTCLHVVMSLHVVMCLHVVTCLHAADPQVPTTELRLAVSQAESQVIASSCYQ